MRGDRFNSPDGAYGVCYVAHEMHGRSPGLSCVKRGLVLSASDFLARKGYVELTTIKRLKLIEFTGPVWRNLVRQLRCRTPNQTTLRRRLGPRLSMTIPCDADAIAYTARHDDGQICYALFDRDPKAVALRQKNLEIDCDWFWAMARTHGMGRAP